MWWLKGPGPTLRLDLHAAINCYDQRSITCADEHHKTDHDKSLLKGSWFWFSRWLRLQLPSPSSSLGGTYSLGLDLSYKKATIVVSELKMISIVFNYPYDEIACLSCFSSIATPKKIERYFTTFVYLFIGLIPNQEFCWGFSIVFKHWIAGQQMSQPSERCYTDTSATRFRRFGSTKAGAGSDPITTAPRAEPETRETKSSTMGKQLW